MSMIDTLASELATAHKRKAWALDSYRLAQTKHAEVEAALAKAEAEEQKALMAFYRAVEERP